MRLAARHKSKTELKYVLLRYDIIMEPFVGRSTLMRVYGECFQAGLSTVIGLSTTMGSGEAAALLVATVVHIGIQLMAMPPVQIGRVAQRQLKLLKLAERDEIALGAMGIMMIIAELIVHPDAAIAVAYIVVMRGCTLQKHLDLWPKEQPAQSIDGGVLPQLEQRLEGNAIESNAAEQLLGVGAARLIVMMEPEYDGDQDLHLGIDAYVGRVEQRDKRIGPQIEKVLGADQREEILVNAQRLAKGHIDVQLVQAEEHMKADLLARRIRITKLDHKLIDQHLNLQIHGRLEDAHQHRWQHHLVRLRHPLVYDHKGLQTDIAGGQAVGHAMLAARKEIAIVLQQLQIALHLGGANYHCHHIFGLRINLAHNCRRPLRLRQPGATLGHRCRLYVQIEATILFAQLQYDDPGARYVYVDRLRIRRRALLITTGHDQKLVV